MSHEQLISLSDATQFVPVPTSPRTLWRWCVLGVGGTKLEHMRIAGRIVTTREAVERFLAHFQEPAAA